MLRFEFASEFQIHPDRVGRTKGTTYERWKLRAQVVEARKAYKHRDSYRDKDGNKNWAEWANKFPNLKSQMLWALDDTDEYGQDNS